MRTKQNEHDYAMASAPLVSILVNNYNYGRFLGEAIESALNQSYPCIEVLVVDDGSTDDSRDIINTFANRIVPIFKQNGGQASAFNAGFANSHGEIVCFLDSDDIFAPSKVAHVVQIITAHPEIGWCWDIERKFDDVTGAHIPNKPATHRGRWDARHLMVSGVPPGVPTACSGMSFSRKTLGQILPMPENFRITGDAYVKLAALALSEGWLEQTELTFQRIHRNNLYTQQPSKRRRRLLGRTGLLIGIHLQERFPSLERTATNLLTRGLGMAWATGGVDPDCKPALHTFLSNLSVPSRVEVLSKAALWTARNLVRI
jgi:glycosyltransferase involved in cell wall biosynthesis